MEQRIDEWTKTYNDEYFNRQFKTPYRSTVKFCDWLEELDVINTDSQSNILDIATGKGATLYYMQQRFPHCSFLGIDINNDFVQQGNCYFTNEQIQNCKLEYGDLYNLNLETFANKYEGIVMLQTLSWLPEAESALSEIIKLNPQWVAFSSLFYDGLVECKAEIYEYENFNKIKTKDCGDMVVCENVIKFKKSSYYNTYSIPKIKAFFEENGYKVFKYSPFEIDVDLPKLEHSHMGTHTLLLSNGKRLQVSGPLLMNWYFIYAERCNQN